MNLADVLADLYRNEINFEIGSLWDGGITVRIGDHLNGHEAERVFGPDETDSIARWLGANAAKSWPESPFAAKWRDAR